MSLMRISSVVSCSSRTSGSLQSNTGRKAGRGSRDSTPPSPIDPRTLLSQNPPLQSSSRMTWAANKTGKVALVRETHCLSAFGPGLSAPEALGLWDKAHPGQTDRGARAAEARRDERSLHLAGRLCVFPPFSANTGRENKPEKVPEPPVPPSPSYPRPSTDRSAPLPSPKRAGSAGGVRRSAAARRRLSEP